MVADIRDDCATTAATLIPCWRCARTGIEVVDIDEAGTIRPYVFAEREGGK